MSTLAALGESFKARTEQNQQQMEAALVQSLEDLNRSLQHTLQTELTSTAGVIKSQHQTLRQTVADSCQDMQNLGRAMSWRFLRRVFLLCLPVCLLTAIVCIACIVATRYQCRSMEDASEQRMEDIRKSISQYQNEHRKIAEKFQNLQSYQDENGQHYLALGKAWRLKEIREKDGHILWQVVKR